MQNVKVQLPLKQGLKPHISYNQSPTGSHVKIQLPLKQGLKQHEDIKIIYKF